TGEMRFGLVNDRRGSERRLPRMVDRCATLALPSNKVTRDKLPLQNLPVPQLVVPPAALPPWRARMNLPGDGQPIAVLAPGAVGPSKRWTAYEELGVRLTDIGLAVWVVGGPGETEIAAAIARRAPGVRDLTGTDLRNAILALKAATVAVSNDS